MKTLESHSSVYSKIVTWPYYCLDRYLSKRRTRVEKRATYMCVQVVVTTLTSYHKFNYLQLSLKNLRNYFLSKAFEHLNSFLNDIL